LLERRVIHIFFQNPKAKTMRTLGLFEKDLATVNQRLAANQNPDSQNPGRISLNQFKKTK
jgi:hypothetical protein